MKFREQAKMGKWALVLAFVVWVFSGCGGTTKPGPSDFDLSVQTEGSDPDLPDFSTEGPDYGFQPVEGETEFEFTRNILAPDATHPVPPGKSQYFFVWGDKLGERTITQATYFRRKMGVDNTVAGSTEPSFAHFDSASGYWFIPWRELFPEGESWLSLDVEQMLTLTLFLDDQSTRELHIRFRAQGPIPELDSSWDEGVDAQSQASAQDRVSALSLGGAVIGTQEIDNPTSRPLKIWFNAALTGGGMETLLDADAASSKFLPPAQRLAASRAGIQLSGYDFIPGAGASPVPVDYSPGRWDSLDLPAFSALQIRWKAQASVGTPRCTLQVESQVDTRSLCEWEGIPFCQSFPANLQAQVGTHWGILQAGAEGTWVGSLRVSDPTEAQAQVVDSQSLDPFTAQDQGTTQVSLEWGDLAHPVVPDYPCQGAFPN